MKIVFIGEDRTIKTERGLLDMSKKELAGRLEVVFTRFKVDSKGRCTPLAENKKALFVVLKDEEIAVGEYGAKFYKGLRLDNLSGTVETELVLVRTAKVLTEQQKRFHGVQEFLKKIHAGDKPNPEEVPKALLSETV